MNTRCLNEFTPEHEWQRKLKHNARTIDQMLSQEGPSESPELIEWPFMRRMIQYQFLSDKEPDKNQQNNRVIIFNSLDDHVKEIFKYCVQNEFDGLFTDDLELITLYLRTASSTFPRLLTKPLFSCQTIKFWRWTERENTFNVSAYNPKKIMSRLNLSLDQFSWLIGILLGSRWFPYQWLTQFYMRLIQNKKTIENWENLVSMNIFYIINKKLYLNYLDNERVVRTVRLDS